MQEVYAQALLKLVEKGESPHSAVQKIHEVLKVSGRMTLFPKIARAFERLAQKSIEKNAVRLFVANHDDARHAKNQAEHALGATHENIQIHTDSTLIGGWRVEAGEKLIDLSYKKQLLSIFNRATQ